MAKSKTIANPAYEKILFNKGVCNAIPTVGRAFNGILEVGFEMLDRGIVSKEDDTPVTNALVLGLYPLLQFLGAPFPNLDVG